MNDDNDDVLGPCECFAILQSRTEPAVQCEVCDHIAAVHPSAATRVLSGGAIEEERKRILIERFERREQEVPRPPDPMSEVRTNGDPEVH